MAEHAHTEAGTDAAVSHAVAHAAADIPAHAGTHAGPDAAASNAVHVAAPSVLPFLPFALPDIDEAEIDAVVACLRSGWVTTGPATRQFEQDFAAYLGREAGTDELHAISINSATAGLHLALEGLGIGPGDEVIVPTMTFTATAEVVRYLGAQPVLVDVDPERMNIDLAAVEAAITPRTRAIMPVHYAGLACDMDALLALARRHELRVVEDAAHAFPTRYKGRLVGTLGSDATVFSFYANKTMTTGEGGMLVTRDAALARRVRVMRLHGISQDAFDRYVSRTPAWFYEVVAAGYKYNLTDIAAAIGIQQLRKIDRFAHRREHLARRYDTGLAGLPLRLPPHAGADSTHAWHLYVVQLAPDAPLARDALIQALSERGIGTSVHFIPLHRHPVWRDQCKRAPTDFPVAEACFARILTLPLYTKMRDADQDRIIRTLRELLA